jgi:hypothetical protein
MEMSRISRFTRTIAHIRRPGVAVGTAIALTVLGAGATYAAIARSGHAGPQGDGTGITPTGWHVTPAGQQLTLGERPYGMAVSPDGRHATQPRHLGERQGRRGTDARPEVRTARHRRLTLVRPGGGTAARPSVASRTCPPTVRRLAGQRRTEPRR